MRAFAGRRGFVRIFIPQLAQIEIDPRQHVLCGRDGFRAGGKQPGHFGGMFEMALGVGFQQTSCGFEGPAFANAGQHILQVALAWMGVERVIGRQQGDLRAGGDGVKRRQPPPVASSRLRLPLARPACTEGAKVIK